MAKLFFYYSAMNAGKTTTLLQSSFNYRERGMNTVLFTAKLDNRYDKATITSRIGLSVEANIFDGETDLFAIVKGEVNKGNVGCVMVDEAQFLSKDQVFQLARVADTLDVPVLCYGLRTDFQANLFPGSEHLLAIADQLLELKTICPCGSKATMNLRIDEDGNAVKAGEQTEIGGNDRYISLCRKHFLEKLDSNYLSD